MSGSQSEPEEPDPEAAACWSELLELSKLELSMDEFFKAHPLPVLPGDQWPDRLPSGPVELCGVILP